MTLMLNNGRARGKRRTASSAGRLRAKPGCVLLLAVALILQACAGVQTPASPVPSAAQSPFADKGAEIWKRFRERAEKAELLGGPFRLRAGLRYTDAGGSTQRATALFWGNGKSGDPLPLRLDLQAGIGITAAKIREDAQSTVVYIPRENAAYPYLRLRRPPQSLPDRSGQSPDVSPGVPLPFSPAELALLLTGRGGTLFLPPDGATAVPEYRPTSDGCRFTLRNAALPGLLELSPDGAPLRWRGDDDWTIDIVEAAAADPLRPERLRIAHPGGYAVLIDVRETERVSPPYSEEQLSLILPPGTVSKKPQQTATR